MDQPEPKPVRRTSPVLDTVLTLLVFAFFTWIMRDHVPSNDPVYIWVWGLITASCLTAVFWLAYQMGRAVYRAQRDAARK